MAALIIWLNVPEDGKKSARDFYERGLHLAEIGQVEQAIEALENAIQKDNKFADAYHQLSLLYANLGIVDGRFKATRLLQKALRLDKNNILYHLDMAKLSLKKKMKVDATKYFNKIIELDACHAEAYYHLGLFKEEDMLWYKDLISSHSEMTFFYAKYGLEDMEEAGNFFRKAVQCDPNFADAYYHLALIQYELGTYSAMVDFLRQAIEVQPSNKDFYLFLGLAFHRLGDYDSAFENFGQAKHYMTEEELTLFNSTEPLLSHKMRDVYALMNEESKNQFENVFWKQRDPFFMTEFNERILEHYSRFAYANMRFSKPEKGIKGWQTDQGQTYIRFGPPQTLYRTRPGMASSTEQWQYNEFAINFSDEYMVRSFKFQRSTARGRDYKEFFEQLIKDTPEIYDHDIGGTPTGFPYLITQFRGEGGKTRVEFYYGVFNTQLRPDLWKSDTFTLLKRGLFVFDEQWQDVSREIGIRKLNFAGLENGTPLFLGGPESIELFPGTYNISLELEKKVSEYRGSNREELQVRTFAGNRIEMSDLLLANHIQTAVEESFIDADRKLKIVPSLFHKFTRQQPIFFYFEVYNLQLDEDGLSRYRVETSVSSAGEQKGVLAKFAFNVGKFVGLIKSDQSEVGTSFEYAGDSEQDHIYSSIQLTAAKPGEYKLFIQTTDLNTGQSTGGETTFKIVN